MYEIESSSPKTLDGKYYGVKPNVDGPYKLEAVSSKIDVWFLGVIIYELLTCEPVMQTSREGNLSYTMDVYRLRLWKEIKSFYIHKLYPKVPRSAWDILEKMLHEDPKQRPDVHTLLYDPFLVSNNENGDNSKETKNSCRLWRKIFMNVLNT